jgi:hypothetical protein
MRNSHHRTRPVILPSLAACSQVAACAAMSANSFQFNRDIRPILSENCFVCHGPEKNTRKARLCLDLREVALEREALVPGKPRRP